VYEGQIGWLSSYRLNRRYLPVFTYKLAGMKKTRKPVKLRVPTIPTSQVVYAAKNISLDFFSQSRAKIDMLEVPGLPHNSYAEFCFYIEAVKYSFKPLLG